MADVLARDLTGGDASFLGADLSAKLKLLGTDVATFGDPFQDPNASRAIVLLDQVRGIYKKIVLDSAGTQMLGGILVGDAAEVRTPFASDALEVRGLGSSPGAGDWRGRR